jgi:hypothetical protein
MRVEIIKRWNSPPQNSWSGSSRVMLKCRKIKAALFAVLELIPATNK